MNINLVIEKLVLELDLNSEQEYREFCKQLHARLYPLLEKELNLLLPKLIKNSTENIQIEKIELEIDALSFHELNSTKFINNIKKTISQSIFVTDSTKRESTKKVAFLNIPEQEKNILSAQITSKSRIVSTKESLQQYLLTGQFITNIELTQEQFLAYFDKDSDVDLIVNWISRRNKIQQKTILLRLVLQLTHEHKKMFFKHKEIKRINKSLQSPIILDELYTNSFSSRKKDKVIAIDSLYAKSKIYKKDILKINAPIIRGQASNEERCSSEEMYKKDILKMNAPIIGGQASNEERCSSEEMYKKDILKMNAPIIRGQASNEYTYSSSGEEFYIKNAGIVIIAPYLQALFHKSNLLLNTQKSFKNQYCAFYAIHLLAYLASKSILKMENNSFLYKVLCGISVGAPIALQLKIEEKDKQLVKRLLLQVVKKWNIKFNDNVDLLRGSFFYRNGKLSQTEGYWKLQVETKTFDLPLLGKLPWSFKYIHLPWMKQRMHVEWY